MSKTYLSPEALFPSQQSGFSQGVATLGKTAVYVSGQVGSTKNGSLEPK